MDHNSIWYRYLMSRHGGLPLGIAFLAMALIFTLTGRALNRRGMIYRAEDPKGFWRTVSVCYLFSLFSIGFDFFLYAIK